MLALPLLLLTSDKESCIIDSPGLVALLNLFVTFCKIEGMEGLPMRLNSVFPIGVILPLR